MTPTQRSQHFPNASESFKRLNPHLFGVGAVPATVAQPIERKPQGDAASKARGKGGVGERGRFNFGRITLIACRNRELDRDHNLAYSFKHLQDAIADSLLPGLPTGRADSYFRWEYGQVETRGEEGVIVKIEV